MLEGGPVAKVSLRYPSPPFPALPSRLLDSQGDEWIQEAISKEGEWAQRGCLIVVTFPAPAPPVDTSAEPVRPSLSPTHASKMYSFTKALALAKIEEYAHLSLASRGRRQQIPPMLARPFCSAEHVDAACQPAMQTARSPTMLVEIAPSVYSVVLHHT
jgi:hypothetical protein